MEAMTLLSAPTVTHYRSSPYLAKCKRLRTDGPTPCLCCPGECVGDHPGYTFAEALIAKSYWDDPELLLDPELLGLVTRHPKPSLRMSWYMWLFGLGPTALVLFGLYAKWRGWL